MALPLLTSASKLPTTFDYWAHRIHALLGLFVLCHFLYRYGMFFFLSSQDGGHDMGFDVLTSMGVVSSNFQHTIVFVKLFMPHLLIQCTGFAFPLPTKRHPDGNRIWPQYRWEAVVFCIRCISLAFIAWRRKLYKQTLEDGSCSILPALCCVGLTMLSADKVANWYRTNNVGVTGNRTIRDLTAPKWAQYFMSSAQFHATVHCLLTSNRLSVQIAALTVVQLSAFGMTLRRKGYITQKEGVLLYALVLLMGMLVIMDDLRRRSLFHLSISFGNSTAVLRMYVGMNKYALWVGVATALAYLQRQGMLSDSFSQWSAVMNISSWILLFLSCHLKHR